MSGAAANTSEYPGRADRIDERASDFLIRRCDLEGWSDADQAELDSWLRIIFSPNILLAIESDMDAR